MSGELTTHQLWGAGPQFPMGFPLPAAHLAGGSGCRVRPCAAHVCPRWGLFNLNNIMSVPASHPGTKTLGQRSLDGTTGCSAERLAGSVPWWLPKCRSHTAVPTAAGVWRDRSEPRPRRGCGGCSGSGGMPAQCSPGPGRGWLAGEGDLLEEAAGRDIFPAGTGAANAETCAHTGNWMRCSPQKSAASPAACLDLQTIIFSCFSSPDL